MGICTEVLVMQTEEDELRDWGRSLSKAPRALRQEVS